ncbi:hypothetical protein GCM10027091_72280 [Streptomyces daliensis]
MTVSRAPQRPPHLPRHRVLTLLIVVLLIAIPAGYLVISAFQSRDSGEDKERSAGATSLTYQWPSKVQRRIYDVPIPPLSTRVGFYEENAWDTSSLWVQFRNSDRRLSQFLADLGTSTSALEKGRVTISDKRAEKVGWDLDEEGHTFAGTTVEQSGDQPDLAITVDTTFENRPRVYVVSKAEF